MADDGLLLNFQLPSDAFAPKHAFKGGTWKDRLTAKKAQQNWTRKSVPRFEDNSPEDEELIIPGARPSKRARIDGPRPAAKSSNAEVISSLFSYNPKAAPAPEPPVEEVDVDVQPTNAPLNDELALFTTLGLSTTLAGHLTKVGIKKPTAIQRKAIQQLCTSDTDAFIQAETGSGKTLAYLLPLLQRITTLSKQIKDAGSDFKRKNGLLAIILAPTRELSKQINTVLESLLACCHWIVAGTVIGGEDKKSEKARLRKGVNILVATPGRLADHLTNTEALDVSKVRWLVLDEGDELMKLGFEQDIQKMISILNLRSRKAQDPPLPGLPDRRTTVLCSATIKADVDKLKSIVLKEAVSIAVDAAEAENDLDRAGPVQAFSAPAQLKQSYAVVPAKQRLVTLTAILKQAFRRKGSLAKCIAFMSCADSVDFHFEIMSRGEPASSGNQSENDAGGDDDHTSPRKTTTPGLSRSDKIPQGNTISESRTQALATAFSTKDNPAQLFRLHGSLQQSIRTSTLKAFVTSTQPSVLVCTDVASRGLDLPNVDLVIEYDPPFSKDDHLHRIGRTARAGKDGRAMIFLMPGCEEGYVNVLKEGRPHKLTRHDADELLKKGFSSSGSTTVDKDWGVRATEWQLDAERWAAESPHHLEQARRAYQSHIRAYATHTSAERSIFDIKQLHLGHLAKAFALRDKPGSIRVPGLRPGKASGKDVRGTGCAAKTALGNKRAREDDDGDAPVMTDEQEARRKMRAKVKSMGGASEFNLG